MVLHCGMLKDIYSALQERKGHESLFYLTTLETLHMKWRKIHLRYRFEYDCNCVQTQYWQNNLERLVDS